MATITTIYGNMDESELEKRSGSDDANVGQLNEEHVDWVEYWLDGELVHRSAHVILTGLIAQSVQGEM